jgi:hypothetical protein
MASIPVKPQNGVNPAGPLYERRTDAFIARNASAGNISPLEGKVLRKQEADIRGRVASDKEQGLDPKKDPELAKMQMGHRAAANQFADFNPGKENAKEPRTFTDKDGNEVTRTPDGYTSVKNADGTTTTLTPGGYEIKYDSANATATITDTRSGESTTIWGDPHVSESDRTDGSYWDWQSDTSTYVLPDGTKITMNSTGGDETNGFGTLESMDIYSSTGRTHISSSAEGTTLTGDSRRADAQQDDGDVYFGNLQANDWRSKGVEM